ncbi:hypothetical protein F4780DRAFT_274613 [Xylariomycetidae sp. FL0641]|nr:hypothetical protein F4780DRAFT_274613 [Xylariomycetidae sp. FL0641]
MNQAGFLEKPGCSLVLEQARSLEVAHLPRPILSPKSLQGRQRRVTINTTRHPTQAAMAHSPLQRTLHRRVLDKRSAWLVEYELAVEQASRDLHGLPPPASASVFDVARWTERRREYNSITERMKKNTECVVGYVAAIKQQVWRMGDPQPRARPLPARLSHYRAMMAMCTSLVPPKPSRVKLALSKTPTAYRNWKPRPVADILRAEDDLSRATGYGRVRCGDTGILDPHALHSVLTPTYVPRLHIQWERARLRARNAEFNSYSLQQAALPPSQRIQLAGPPPSDTSDEGMLIPSPSADAESDSEKENSKTRKRKRKHPPARGRKARVERLHERATHHHLTAYGILVANRAQLKSQAWNYLVLLQQRLPRVEVPAPAVVLWPAHNQDTDPEAEAGIPLPVLRGGEGEEELMLDDAIRYRDWRTGRSEAKPFFDARDRYLRARVFGERAADHRLVRAARRLWAWRREGVVLEGRIGGWVDAQMT